MCLYQPNAFINISNCNIVGNCANGKCLIAAYFQGESKCKMREREIDEAIAEAIDALVEWSDLTDLVILVCT